MLLVEVPEILRVRLRPALGARHEVLVYPTTAARAKARIDCLGFDPFLERLMSVQRLPSWEASRATS